MGFCEGRHEFPQCREAFVALLDLPVVAFLNIDDIVAMILQDLRREQQRLLNSSNVPIKLGHVSPGQVREAPELLQLVLPSEDCRSQSQDAGEVIHCSGPLTTQLGVLLDEIVDRCLQSHVVLVLALVIHLLVVASPCMPQVDHLALPFIESRMEHVLGPLSLPGRIHVKVVKLSMDRSERNGDGSIRIRRVKDPVLLPRCTQPSVLGWDRLVHTPRRSPP